MRVSGRKDSSNVALDACSLSSLNAECVCWTMNPSRLRRPLLIYRSRNVKCTSASPDQLVTNHWSSSEKDRCGCGIWKFEVGIVLLFQPARLLESPRLKSTRSFQGHISVCLNKSYANSGHVITWPPFPRERASFDVSVSLDIRNGSYAKEAAAWLFTRCYSGNPASGLRGCGQQEY